MNQIHPTVIIEGDVHIGENNIIHPYTVLIGPLVIGDNNKIGPNVSIGTPGQDTRNPNYDYSDKKIIIGNNNIIREHTTIQKPAYEDLTILGNNIYIMSHVHIPHDAHIQDAVTLTPMVALGGICRILEGATISLGSCLRQYGVIGQHSFVAMGATIAKNVKPFSRYIPGKPISVNTYAINKIGYEEFTEEISEYVLHDKPPKSEKIRKIVNCFEELHKKTQIGLY